MTYRDWMSENLPGLGTFGCPRHYFSDLKNEPCPMKDGTVNSCWSCWNREMKNPDSGDCWWMPEEPTKTAVETPKDDSVTEGGNDMTYRNWIENHHPECVGKGWTGGVKGCPSDYQLEPESEPPCCNDKHVTCEECWNREMPEEPTKTAVETPKDDSVKDDPVNHPTHYTSGGVECIDAIGAALCKYTDGVDAWLAGQVIKYLWRAPLKENYTQDIAKAQFYMNRLARRQEKTE